MKYDNVPEEFTFEEEVDNYIKQEKKFMEKFRTFLVWFVTSSADRSKFALTLKAGIPFLVLLNISDTETLENLSGAIGVVLANLGELITAVLTAWGLIRKIYLSFKE